MESAPTLRLSSWQTLRALERIDLLQVLRARLVSPPAAAGGLPWPDGAPPATEATEATDRETVVNDLATGPRCLLPTATLQLIRTAGLATLAARELVAPGAATAAIFGSGEALQLQAKVMARYLSMLSHVALARPSDEPAPAVPEGLADELELFGVSLSIDTDQRDAAFGANLFVAARTSRPDRQIRTLLPGALLVNGSGQDLPPGLLSRVDRIFVDDCGLLAANRHRRFTQPGPAEPEHKARTSRSHREGWYQHPQDPHGALPVVADLRDVLSDASLGRADDDEILLVELLGTGLIDLGLAWWLRKSAVELGLGDWIDNA